MFLYLPLPLLALAVPYTLTSMYVHPTAPPPHETHGLVSLVTTPVSVRVCRGADGHGYRSCHQHGHQQAVDHLQQTNITPSAATVC